MNKLYKRFISLGVALSCLSACSFKGVFAMDEKKFHVDFFSNYAKEEFTLSSGFNGRGNNLLYKTIDVNENSLVEKPTDPERKNYEFSGWFKEDKCVNEWNFSSDKVTGNTRLFAKWTFISEDEDSGEPTYTPPSTVLDEEESEDYIIDSIMNFKIEEDNKVKISTSALAKLEANKEDVLSLMEYRVKNSKTISATYNEKVITVTCGEDVRNIQVVDNSNAYKLGNADYETKATKYEAKILDEIENYHVMLAGSSSIEFWKNSGEDLEPIVSFNHGIGGTTIEEWDSCLNQRLVYPYKPKMVVYYVGINNVINSKQEAGVIWTHLKNFMDHTHAAMPNTKVQYILMNLIPGYKDYWDTINSVNDKIIQYQKDNTWLTLINPGMSLLKNNGTSDVLPVGEKTKVVTNVQLYAQWVDGTSEEASYKVTFNPNGGKGNMEPVLNQYGEYILPENEFEPATEVIVEEEVEKEYNKTFVGWKVDGQGRVYSPGEKIFVASDVELCAVWVGKTPEPTPITYTIRFNSNGGAGSMPNVTQVAGEYKLPGCYFAAPEGKKFAGWRAYSEPNAAYFRIDGLHLSEYGYVLWGGVIKQSIIDGLNN